MPDEEDQPVTDDAPKTPWRPERGWRDLWQAPALLFGAVLLSVGLMVSLNATPKNDFPGALDDVDAMIQLSRFDDAMTRLNAEILPRMVEAEGELPSSIRARFHLLRGDAIYMAQSESGGNQPANSRAVIDEYNESERLLVPLTAERVARYASMLMLLGRYDEAIDRIHSLPDESADVQRKMIRRVIEQTLDAPDGEPTKALELLGELTSDPALSEKDRIWALITRARLRLEAGYTEEAINNLLLALQRNKGLDATNQAQLYILLARAYEELGQLEESGSNVQRAIDRLSPSDRLMGQAHVVAGRIAQSRGALENARDEYAVVVSDFIGSDSWRQGLLGLAETRAMLGEPAQAFESYQTLVQTLNEHGAHPDVPRRAVEDSLLNQVSGSLAREDYISAKRYAEIARDLYQGEKPSAAVSLARARSERLLADQTMDPARATPEDPPDPSLLDPVTRADVRSLYMDAGEHYLAHARDMILFDDDAFAESLWNSADCFDLAGDLERAIEVFSEYANGRTNDPRRPAAEFRLAQAHQARGDYDVAERFYRGLIEENPNSGEGTRSLVWLARTLLQDEDATNDAEAERLLRRVVDGRLLAPDAIDFRAGLIDLGRYYFHTGEYQPAIRRLDEAVRRYPESRRIDVLRYELAGSHRMRAEELVQLLKQAMPETKRRRIDQQRREHLESAFALYERVRTDLLAIDARRLTPTQRSYLRNAYFYKADSAFDLGDYDRAIEYYDTAAQRYADDPVSLVAMAQIVSAFLQQGRTEEARKANERARQRLNDFPDQAFESGDLPLARKHWERWLDSTDALSRQKQQPTSQTASAPIEP